MTFFMLLAPVVGPLYLGVSALLYEIYFKRRKEIVNIEELSFRKEKLTLIPKDNLESALNKVPIEEALLVSGVHSTRRLILDVLKEDTSRYVNSINKATYNEDSEVSHYAASAITGIMNKFKQKERRLRENFEADERNEIAAEMYWFHISEFLQMHVLPQVEQERYLKILENLTNRLEENYENCVTGEMYFTLTQMNVGLGKMKAAEVWVDRALDKRSDDIYSYKAGLQYYYESNQFNKYRKLLDQLMESAIRLDYETLELIRFYQQ